MKISKLFHWLYAILMLLPFAFFVPSVLYYAFNDNATMQSVEVPKTETIAVDFNQKANTRYVGFTETDRGTTYTFLENGIEISGNPTANIYIIFLLQSNQDNDHIYYYGGFETNLSGSYGAGFNQNTNRTTNFIGGLYGNLTFSVKVGADLSSPIICNYPQCIDLTQMFGAGNEPTLSEFESMNFGNNIPYIDSELMQITYETGETEQLVENTSIINYAWESIWDLPLFSWTKVTFVSVPFSYLTGIFGLGANNSLNYVFGYFVTISIVWLVFDLLLYVPMLAHNWIDKARIE